MDEVTPLTGELQVQVMATLWRLGSATVEQVRGGLPPRYRGAYNTIQTVLNRLADRNLLSRHKIGNAFAYDLSSPRRSASRSRSRRFSRAHRSPPAMTRWRGSSVNSTTTN